MVRTTFWEPPGAGIFPCLALFEISLDNFFNHIGVILLRFEFHPEEVPITFWILADVVPITLVGLQQMIVITSLDAIWDQSL